MCEASSRPDRSSGRISATAVARGIILIGAALVAVQACKPNPLETKPEMLAQISPTPPPVKFQPETPPPRPFVPEPTKKLVAPEPTKDKEESPWDRVHRVWMANICKRCLSHKPACAIRAAKLRSALLNICMSRREAEMHAHVRVPVQPEGGHQRQ